MKRLWKALPFLILCTLILIPAMLFGSDPSPVPSVVSVPIPAIPGPSVFQVLWGWVSSHQFVVGGFVAAVFDFVFAVKPEWASNGVIHWVYLMARKWAGLPAPAPSA